MSAPFTVLTVCTGNICRSPLAERLLVQGFSALAAQAGPAWTPGRGVAVASAGVAAHVGEAMTPETAALVAAAGGDPAGHIARQLTPRLAEEAGLVLALSREHRARVVSLAPSVNRRTFALGEFARIAGWLADSGWEAPGLEAVPGELLARLVEEAALSRGLVPPLDDPAQDDVVDPYLAGPEVYALTGEQVSRAAAELFAALGRLIPGRD